jgi:hypothetical protein
MPRRVQFSPEEPSEPKPKTTADKVERQRKELPDGDSPLLRRSRHCTKGTHGPRYGFDGDGVGGYLAIMDKATDLALEGASQSTVCALAHMMLLATDPDTGIIDDVPGPEVLGAMLKAKKGYDPDTPNYGQAMRGPYHEEFLSAMQKEIQELSAHGTWTAVL